MEILSSTHTRPCVLPEYRWGLVCSACYLSDLVWLLLQRPFLAMCWKQTMRFHQAEQQQWQQQQGVVA